MNDRAEQPRDFAAAFEVAFARLQVLLEMVCAGRGSWPERVTVALRQSLEFAAANPAAASVLTNQAMTQGPDGYERYERLMGYLAGLLEPGRAERSHGADLPASLERSLVGGVATIIANRVDRGGADDLPRLLPEAVQFVLTPYLGTREAIRAAAAANWPDSPPER